jgi:hypothetical protein
MGSVLPSDKNFKPGEFTPPSRAYDNNTSLAGWLISELFLSLVHGTASKHDLGVGLQVVFIF